MMAAAIRDIENWFEMGNTMTFWKTCLSAARLCKSCLNMIIAWKKRSGNRRGWSLVAQHPSVT
jgi:hypothetical protein